MVSSKIKLLVFDFDGVLTDNTVFVDEHGIESVRCSREDGLAFDALRLLEIRTLILSSESNSVVAARGRKLKVKTILNAKDKASALIEYCDKERVHLSDVGFVGNDVNDLEAMNICGVSICPNDAHEEIKNIANFVTNSCGGQGVVREVLEKIIGVSVKEVLYAPTSKSV